MSHSWIIIEAGDGSVSGLSDNQNMISYYRAEIAKLQKLDNWIFINIV